MNRFHALLRAAFGLGMDPDVALRTDVALMADFLGHGPVGEDWDDFDYVAKGSRWIGTKADKKDSEHTPSGQPTQNAQAHVQSVVGPDRRALYAQARGDDT